MRVDQRHYNSKKRTTEAANTLVRNKRIQILGALDDRHKEYLAVGDRQRLLELATEYETMGMPMTARGIRDEAQGLHGGRMTGSR